MRSRDQDGNQPENINANNLNTQGSNNQKQVTNNFVNAPSSLQSDKIIQIFQATLDQVQKTIELVKQFNSNSKKSQHDYQFMENILSKHVTNSIHPAAKTDAGDILLRNGHFILTFIDILSRREKKNYLRKYLFYYFDQLNKISKDKQYFEIQRDKELDQELKIQIKEVKVQRIQRKLLLSNSPSSSRNDANWSTKVEKDTNSPFKSSVFQSQTIKNSDKKLKRNYVAHPQLVNQHEQQRSERAAKNTKKDNKKSKNKNTSKTKDNNSGNKSSKKTKQRTYNSKSKSKSRNKNENEKSKKKLQNKQFQERQQKKGQITSDTKRQTKSITQLLTNNKNIKEDQQHKLGSHYHYQISLNPKNNHKQLIQVRTSARISHRRSKSRSHSKSKSKTKQRSSKKKQQKKNRSKRTKKRNNNQQSSDGSNYSQDSSLISQLNDKIQVEWVKKHLKQLDIHDIQLYSDFTALTKNDNKITQLLLQMENSQQAKQQRSGKQTRKKQIKKKNTSSKKKQQNKQQTQQEKKQQNKQQKEYIKIQLHDQPTQYVQIIQTSITETRVISKKPQQVVQTKAIDESKKILDQRAQKSRKFSQIKKQFEIQALPITIQYVVDPNLCNHGIYALLRLGRVTQLQMGTAYAVSPLTFGASSKKKHIKESLQKARQLAGDYADNIGYIPMNENILDMVKRKNQQLRTRNDQQP